MNPPPSRPSLEARWVRSARAVFRVTGPDRVRYLNGQVSNDVGGPLDRESVAACLCNAKGKVEALVWIQADERGLLLDGELEQRDFLHARLEKYLIADDCEITDVSDELALVHRFGDSGPGVRSRRLGPDMPEGVDFWQRAGDSCPGDAEEGIAPEEWNALCILGRVPRSPLEIDGDALPAELGLDRWAVSFQKGCYLGQEVISRMRTAGKIRRELCLVSSTSPIPEGLAVVTRERRAGRATRESCVLGQKKHFTLAMISAKEASNFDPDNQQLVDSEPTFS